LQKSGGVGKGERPSLGKQRENVEAYRTKSGCKKIVGKAHKTSCENCYMKRIQREGKKIDNLQAHSGGWPGRKKS